MGYKIKPGDLVQSNIFNRTGSGGYGLVMGACQLPRYWNVWWVGYESHDRLEVAEGGVYDIHETDIVVVSSAPEKKIKNETRRSSKV